MGHFYCHNFFWTDFSANSLKHRTTAIQWLNGGSWHSDGKDCAWASQVTAWLANSTLSQHMSTNNSNICDSQGYQEKKQTTVILSLITVHAALYLDLYIFANVKIIWTMEINQGPSLLKNFKTYIYILIFNFEKHNLFKLKISKNLGGYFE